MATGFTVIACINEEHFVSCFGLLQEKCYEPYADKGCRLIFVEGLKPAHEARGCLIDHGLFIR